MSDHPEHDYLLGYTDPDGDKFAISVCPESCGTLFIATQMLNPDDGSKIAATVAVRDPVIALAIADCIRNWAMKQTAMTN